MSSARIMGAGNAGASSKIRLNGITVGDKLQGLSSTIGRRGGINYAGSYGNKRDVIFSMNQLGGVGRKKTMFLTGAGGVSGEFSGGTNFDHANLKSGRVGTIAGSVAVNIDEYATLYKTSYTLKNLDTTIPSGFYLYIKPGYRINITSPHTFSGSVTNDGTFYSSIQISNNQGSTFNNYGLFENAGYFTNSGGEFNNGVSGIINNNMSFDLSSGTITNAGTFNNGWSASILTIYKDTTFNNKGGKFWNDADFFLRGNFLNGGTFENDDIINFSVSAKFTNSSNVILSLGSESTNYGTITNSSNGTITNRGGTITNNGNFLNDGKFLNGGTSGSYGGKINNNGPFDSTGTFDNKYGVISGDTMISNSGTFYNMLGLIYNPATGCIFNTGKFYNNKGLIDNTITGVIDNKNGTFDNTDGIIRGGTLTGGTFSGNSIS